MHYTGEKTVCHYGKRRFSSQRRKYKIHFHDEKICNWNKYLWIDTKNVTPTYEDPIYCIRGREATVNLDPKSQLKDSGGDKLAMLLEKA
jgi:hypothetical protein